MMANPRLMPLLFIDFLPVPVRRRAKARYLRRQEGACRCRGLCPARSSAIQRGHGYFLQVSVTTGINPENAARKRSGPGPFPQRQGNGPDHIQWTLVRGQTRVCPGWPVHPGQFPVVLLAAPQDLRLARGGSRRSRPPSPCTW